MEIGTYPFDLLRRRMMVQGRGGEERIYSSIWDACRKIYVFEGISGFFKGIIPSYLKVSCMVCYPFFLTDVRIDLRLCRQWESVLELMNFASDTCNERFVYEMAKLTYSALSASITTLTEGLCLKGSNKRDNLSSFCSYS